MVSILNNGCKTDIEYRKKLACEAFQKSSDYDCKIYSYLGSENININFEKDTIKELRYGENPHQKGRFIGQIDKIFEQIHGKDISYNNLLDIDSAIGLLNDLESKESVFLIHKHNNPCGVALRDNILDAYLDALSCDNVSAFGGILTSNQIIDIETAMEIDKLFFEVLIAPNFTSEAQEILNTKPNIRVLRSNNVATDIYENKMIHGVGLVQSTDIVNFAEMKLEHVTNNYPSKHEIDDLIFAMKVAKHAKSNAIVLAKNKMTLGIGAGQMSRVVSTKIAFMKAEEEGLDVANCVLASDAFFPFRDNIDFAASKGVLHIIQPGGSIKDDEVIKAAEEKNLTMTFTGVRHFKH